MYASLVVCNPLRIQPKYRIVHLASLRVLRTKWVELGERIATLSDPIVMFIGRDGPAIAEP